MRMEIEAQYNILTMQDRLVKELRLEGISTIEAAGVKVPYSTYDKLGAIDQGAIVENKR